MADSKRLCRRSCGRWQLVALVDRQCRQRSGGGRVALQWLTSLVIGFGHGERGERTVGVARGCLGGVGCH